MPLGLSIFNKLLYLPKTFHTIFQEITLPFGKHLVFLPGNADADFKVFGSKDRNHNELSIDTANNLSNHRASIFYLLS